MRAIPILVIVIVFAAAIGWRIRTLRRTRMSLLNRITAAVAAQTSVVASVATAFAALAQKVRDEAAALAEAGADTTALDNLASEIESHTASLSQAVAANTPASDEVHADDGGTGTAETVVEPVAAPIEAAPADDAAAAAGAGEEQAQN